MGSGLSGSNSIAAQSHKNKSGNLRHLEQQQSLQNFITNISNQKKSTYHFDESIAVEEERKGRQKKVSKYQERQQSGSQSKIPIYKGSDNNSSGSDRGRSSSLTNYQGRIPRISSNERLHDKAQEGASFIHIQDYSKSTNNSKTNAVRKSVLQQPQ